MNPDQQVNLGEQPPVDPALPDLAVPEATPAPIDQTPPVVYPAPFPVEELSDPADSDDSDAAAGSTADETPVTWTANEYIHLEKNGLWYILFGLVVLGLVASDIFFLKSWTFSALVIVMAAAVIVYSRRPPRVIQYALSVQQGLYVGERLYSFGDFKAFGLIRDGQEHSIMLLPLKRFSAGLSVYFPEEVGEKIVDILGSRLPMETLKLDMIDIIVRRLRL